MARESRVYTIDAAVPVQLSPESLIVERIFIQMLAVASGGMGYVMDGVRPGTTPVPLTTPTIELAPAPSALAPGGSYSDADYNSTSIDLQRLFITGSHTGDLMLVTYITKSR